MEFSRNQIGIAAGAGALLLLIFFGYIMHLNGQGPVLDRSEERDPLSGVPNSISLNPLRDRTSEREAAKFIRSMRDGNCKEELANWAKDYRKKYAAFLCDSEAQHPLVSWEVVDWEDTPPLRTGALARQTPQRSRSKRHVQGTLLRNPGEERRRMGCDQVRLHVLKLSSVFSRLSSALHPRFTGPASRRAFWNAAAESDTGPLAPPGPPRCRV